MCLRARTRLGVPKPPASQYRIAFVRTEVTLLHPLLRQQKKGERKPFTHASASPTRWRASRAASAERWAISRRSSDWTYVRAACPSHRARSRLQLPWPRTSAADHAAGCAQLGPFKRLDPKHRSTSIDDLPGRPKNTQPPRAIFGERNIDSRIGRQTRRGRCPRPCILANDDAIVEVDHRPSRLAPLPCHPVQQHPKSPRSR